MLGWGVAGVIPAGILPPHLQRVCGAPDRGTRTPHAGDVSAPSPLRAPQDIPAPLNPSRASLEWLHRGQGDLPGHIPAAEGAGAAALCVGTAGWGGRWMWKHLWSWGGASRDPQTHMSHTSQPHAGAVGVCKAHRCEGNLAAAARSNPDSHGPGGQIPFLGPGGWGLSCCPAQQQCPSHKAPQNQSAVPWVASEAGGI